MKQEIKKNKILILGVSGLLGSTLFKYFSSKKYFKVMGVNRINTKLNKSDKYLKLVKNINNDKEIEKVLKKVKPDYVINCIGIVKNNKNLNQMLKIFEINAFFPKKIEILSKIYKFKFIHISTDCVFKGDKGNYNENYIPDANDLYGISKILGECESENCLTLRTSIIGHSRRDKRGLLEWFLSQKKSIKGYNNAFFSGFTTLELSKIIHDNIIKKKKFQRGVFHLSSKRISKFNLLNKINKLYKKNINIIKYDKIKIDRSLNSSIFKKIINYKVKNWDQMLLEMKNFNEK